MTKNPAVRNLESLGVLPALPKNEASTFTKNEATTNRLPEAKQEAELIAPWKPYGATIDPTIDIRNLEMCAPDGNSMKLAHVLGWLEMQSRMVYAETIQSGVNYVLVVVSTVVQGQSHVVAGYGSADLLAGKRKLPFTLAAHDAICSCNKEAGNFLFVPGVHFGQPNATKGGLCLCCGTRLTALPCFCVCCLVFENTIHGLQDYLQKEIASFDCLLEQHIQCLADALQQQQDSNTKTIACATADQMDEVRQCQTVSQHKNKFVFTEDAPRLMARKSVRTNLSELTTKGIFTCSQYDKPFPSRTCEERQPLSQCQNMGAKMKKVGPLAAGGFIEEILAFSTQATNVQGDPAGLQKNILEIQTTTTSHKTSKRSECAEQLWQIDQTALTQHETNITMNKVSKRSPRRRNSQPLGIPSSSTRTGEEQHKSGTGSVKVATGTFASKSTVTVGSDVNAPVANAIEAWLMLDWVDY
jgi:hypothetical protein